MAAQKKESSVAWLPAVLLLLLLGCSLPGDTQQRRTETLKTLTCNHCPMHHKERSCADVTTSPIRCLPDERCASSRGHYGSHRHVLSGQGCVPRELCGGHEFQTHGAARYNVSHVCCCRDRCNHPPAVESDYQYQYHQQHHSPDEEACDTYVQ